MAREMKDSGVEWIGEIPREWEVVKNKYILKEIYSGGTPTSSNENFYSDKGIPFVSIGDMNLKGKIYETKKYLTDLGIKDKNLKIVNEGTILYSIYATIGNVSQLGIKSTISQALLALTLYEKKYNKNFYKYNLIAMKEFVISLSNGNTQNNLNAERVKNFLLVFPPLEEQEKIANYLDKKVSEIDLIIEKTKATIEDYKKYKQSIITEAVTKGINPNVEMKDSGIKWIGEIPKHWGNKRLKQISYIRARLGWKGLKAEEYTQEGYMFLSAFNIINSKLDFTETNFINSYRYEESPEIKLKVGDVLIVKDGAGIGKCAYVEYLPNEATINGSIALISTNEELKGKFLYYYFLTKIMQKYVDRLKDGMGVPHLFQKDIKEIRICIPPLEEQNQIAEYLDKKTSEIDTLITKKEALIVELEEYKKSLIYECVTGKKEIK